MLREYCKIPILCPLATWQIQSWHWLLQGPSGHIFFLIFFQFSLRRLLLILSHGCAWKASLLMPRNPHEHELKPTETQNAQKEIERYQTDQTKCRGGVRSSQCPVLPLSPSHRFAPRWALAPAQWKWLSVIYFAHLLLSQPLGALLHPPNRTTPAIWRINSRIICSLDNTVFFVRA